VFEHAPHARLLTDLSGAIQVANVAASTLLRASQESLTGRQLAASLPEHERDTLRLHLAQLQAGGVLQDWEVNLQPASGDAVPVSLDAVPVRDLEHRIVGFQWLLRDISRQAQAEEALRQSEGKYRLLVESLHDGVWLLDKDNCTTFANPRMAEMLGYTVDEMLGRHQPGAHPGDSPGRAAPHPAA
jgi:two-component system, NtrC family, sensor kinase